MNTESTGKNATILIVDDNPNNIKVIAIILRTLKYKIVIATNGEQAIDLVEQTRPDLILLDVMMPKIDGFETCKIIKSKSENENIPVIFITALTDSDSLVKGFRVGGVDYITKPFNKDELVSRVKTHLDLKLTRDRLIQTTNHLEELNALKDKMFSVIGHDLRSPLSSVKMTLEFLSQVKKSEDDPFAENINIMLKTTDEVFGLLENLLGWAKSESGNLNINKEVLKLDDIVFSIHMLNKGNIAQKNINFETDVTTSDTIFADLNTFKIVLRNLVSNSIKFTPDGGTIKILSEYKDDKVRITVADNGVGIEEENISKLFNPAIHHTTYGTKSEAGSGLGLTLCHDFIVKNDGRIWVESELGKGTQFHIELPIDDKQQE